jgi:hypothetical protein
MDWPALTSPYPATGTRKPGAVDPGRLPPRRPVYPPGPQPCSGPAVRPRQAANEPHRAAPSRRTSRVEPPRGTSCSFPLAGLRRRSGYPPKSIYIASIMVKRQCSATARVSRYELPGRGICRELITGHLRGVVFHLRLWLSPLPAPAGGTVTPVDHQSSQTPGQGRPFSLLTRC